MLKVRNQFVSQRQIRTLSRENLSLAISSTSKRNLNSLLPKIGRRENAIKYFTRQNAPFLFDSSTKQFHKDILFPFLYTINKNINVCSNGTNHRNGKYGFYIQKSAFYSDQNRHNNYQDKQRNNYNSRHSSFSFRNHTGRIPSSLNIILGNDSIYDKGNSTKVNDGEHLGQFGKQLQKTLHHNYDKNGGPPTLALGSGSTTREFHSTQTHDRKTSPTLQALASFIPMEKIKLTVKNATETTTKAFVPPVVSKDTNQKILKTLMIHLWPDKSLYPDANMLKARVVISSLFLVAGKLVTIQVPFMFKNIIDNLTVHTNIGTTTAATTTGSENNVSSISELIDSGAVDIISTIDTTLLAMLLGYGIARSTSSGFQELRNTIFATVSNRAIRKVSLDVFAHLHALDLQFHLNKSTGSINRIIDRGARSIKFVLSSLLFNIVPTGLEIGLVTYILASKFGLLHAGITLSTILAYSSFTFSITQWRTKFRKDMNRLENEAGSRCVDSLLNYETVKYFNNEKHEMDKYDECIKGFQKATLRTQESLSLLNFGQNFIFSLGLTAMMIVTTGDVLLGKATVGDLVLVNGLLFQLSIPLNFIGSIYREVTTALTDMEAMFNILHTKTSVNKNEDNFTANSLLKQTQEGKPQRPSPSSSIQPKIQSINKNEDISISFEDVDFSYGNDNFHFNHAQRDSSLILKGTSFHIPKRSTVAIVGTSGCGKSTLLRLLYRFYEPNRGTIKINGIPLQDIDIDHLRSLIGVVPQDTVLFNDTIFYNISYGRLSATREEVIEAAKQAQIHETIMAMPYGYDTLVGERGLKLSGGEKQRVAIARALLKDAPLLLCDEATSSLDSDTEASITKQMRQLGQNRTMLIIAHRLSTIADADKIVVMDQGKVIEQGTHEELLALEDKYYSLWQAQQQQNSF